MYRVALVLMVKAESLQAELQHWAFRKKSIMHTHTELDAGVAQFFCQNEVVFFFFPFFKQATGCLFLIKTQSMNKWLKLHVNPQGSGKEQ